MPGPHFRSQQPTLLIELDKAALVLRQFRAAGDLVDLALDGGNLAVATGSENLDLLQLGNVGVVLLLNGLKDTKLV